MIHRSAHKLQIELRRKLGGVTYFITWHLHSLKSAYRLYMDPENRPESPKECLSLLLEREENSACADCTEPYPTWASTNWGAFICTQCAGVHRYNIISSCWAELTLAELSRAEMGVYWVWRSLPKWLAWWHLYCVLVVSRHGVDVCGTMAAITTFFVPLHK